MKVLLKQTNAQPWISRKEIREVCRLKTEADRREALAPLARKILEREPAFVSLEDWQKEIMVLCTANMASGLVELHLGSNSTPTLPKGKGVLGVIDDLASSLASAIIRNSGLKTLGRTIGETVVELVGLLEDAKSANKVDEFLRGLPTENILKMLEGKVRERLN